jgi:hypothetical protein
MTHQFNRELGSESFEWPGIGVWRAKLAPSLNDPDKPADVAVTNPTDRPMTVFIFLGVDVVLQRNLERHFFAPHRQLDEITIRERLTRPDPLSLRPEYVRTRVVWRPGETLTVPMAWWPSLRDEHLGVVVGGLAPQLLLADETDPPPLHPALVVDNEPAVTGRRRK